MKRTKVTPLMTNFMQPHKAEVVSENDTKLIYDPQTQVTMLLGGGNDRGTRSYDGYKETRKRVNGGYLGSNDAERWTDD